MRSPVTIVDINKKTMSLSDGSQLQFLLDIYPHRSWRVGDEVEVDEMKMKICRITNLTRNKTIAEGLRIRNSDENGASNIAKSANGEYPQTHLYIEWDIEKLFPNTQKILLSDNSLWEISGAFNSLGSQNKEWSEGQTVEVSPVERGSPVGRRFKIRSYAVFNKDIQLKVVGSFLGFRE